MHSSCARASSRERLWFFVGDGRPALLTPEWVDRHRTEVHPLPTCARFGGSGEEPGMRCHRHTSAGASSSLPRAHPQIGVDPLLQRHCWVSVRVMPAPALMSTLLSVLLAVGLVPGSTGLAGVSRSMWPAAAAAGRWLPPVTPVHVRAQFDAPNPDWLPGHRGVDFAVATGTAIRAPALGVVSYAGLVADKPVVTIDHGRIRTTYEPAVATVPLGHVVVAGELFAEVSTGGHCQFDCLHWGARIGDRYLDPLWLVEGYTPVLKTPR